MRKLIPQQEKEIIELYEAGYSSGEIGGKNGVCGATILNVFKRYNVQRCSPSEAALLIRGRHPDLSPSKELAYILGAILGDGSIYPPKNRISLETQLLKFAKKFNALLEKIGVKPALFVLTDGEVRILMQPLVALMNLLSG